MANNRNSRRSSKATNPVVSESPTLSVSAWSKKYKVDHIVPGWDHEGRPYYRFHICSSNGNPIKVVLNCKERNEATGAIIENSDIAVRETSWLGSFYARDIRALAIQLGIARLLFLNNNKLDENVLSAMYNGWFTFKCEPYSEGDIIPGSEGRTYTHSSQTLTIISGALSQESVSHAEDLIIKVKAYKDAAKNQK